MHLAGSDCPFSEMSHPIVAAAGHVQAVLRRTDPQFALSRPDAPPCAWQRTGSRSTIPRSRGGGGAPTSSRSRRRANKGSATREAQASLDLERRHRRRRAGLQRRPDRQRDPPAPRHLARDPQSGRLGRDARRRRGCSQHWRHHDFEGVRPFFCQIEAVETIIWLTEVAPQRAATTRTSGPASQGANEEANPELFRLAMKMATGSGKTTVMAMLIAWQTVNAARSPNSASSSRAAS